MNDVKAETVKVVQEIIQLLEECNYSQPAALWKEKLGIFTANPPDSKEFLAIAEWLKRSVGGMGSFDDMPLTPKPGSRLTPDSAREYQVQLEDRLFSAVERIIPK